MTLRLEPATVADQDDWLTVTAWQGHDRLVVLPEPVGAETINRRLARKPASSSASIS